MSDFTLGAGVGVVLGFLLTIAFLTVFVFAPKINDCELNLPRTQSCKMVAVPSPEASK